MSVKNIFIPHGPRLTSQQIVLAFAENANKLLTYPPWLFCRLTIFENLQVNSFPSTKIVNLSCLCRYTGFFCSFLTFNSFCTIFELSILWTGTVVILVYNSNSILLKLLLYFLATIGRFSLKRDSVTRFSTVFLVKKL